MSTATHQPTSPELDGLTYPQVREAFNPFDAGWMPYFRVLTSMYMRYEDRDWQPPGPHHEQWFRDFESGDDIIRLAHRSSLKTTSTLAFLAGNLEYRDGLSAAWIGNNETLALKKAHTELHTKIVDRNPWLTNLNGSRKEDTKAYKLYPNDASLQVGYLFGGIEGEHVDILVIDDVIKEKGDGDTEEILQWLSSVIVPVQEHGGQTIMIGTRKKPTDIYHRLKDREGFDFVEYPALLEPWDDHFREEDDWEQRRPDELLYTETEHPLDPNRTARVLWDQRGTEYLRDVRSKQDESDFMREFCLIVQTREGAVYSLFDRSEHLERGDIGGKRRTWYGLDWGSGNPAGFTTFVELSDGQIVTIDEEKYPVNGTSDYVDTLTDLQDTWGVGPVYCDPSDKRGVDDLRDEGIDAIAADNDIEAGIRTVKDLLASGELLVHERCENLLEEISAYRYNQTTGKPVKKNDHLVDALRYGIMADEYPVNDTPSGSGTW